MNGPNNKIGWCDYTWNPITGCKRGCEYCYARKIRERFTPEVPFTELIWFDERLEQPLKVKTPSRIFVGSMSDIEYWRKVDVERVLDIARRCPQHTFQFLTKNGEVYSKYDFPKNCWLGQTIVRKHDYKKVENNNLKFLSFEPLLEDIGKYRYPADWYIIGGLTPKHIHKSIWIGQILLQASYFGIPVFIKDNAKFEDKIKEFPKGR